MPGELEYRGMSLAQALRHFAELHFDPRTRHISQAEYELLLRAATALESAGVTSAGTGMDTGTEIEEDA